MAKKTAKEEQSAAKDRTERESAPASKAKGYDESGTPSALALEKVGDAPELKHNNVEQVLEHGEKYQAEKKKHRWG